MKRRLLLTSLGLMAAGLLGYQVARHEAPVFPDTPHGDSRPLVGIASLDSDSYVDAVRASGGIPVVLPNSDPSPSTIRGYLERLDALLLPGGADIPPSEYGEKPHETVEILDEDRFSFEKALGSAWVEETRKPVLGICLGGQWLNVLHGGSLVQDIPSEFNVNHRGTNHPVTLDPDSRLRQIFGDLEFEVNSSHHQAVRRLGRDLRVAARSPDGIIEAIESTDPNRFLIGVQWHPERMVQDDSKQAKLFQAFIEAAKQSPRMP